MNCPGRRVNVFVCLYVCALKKTIVLLECNRVVTENVLSVW